jgi:hypothetical protein
MIKYRFLVVLISNLLFSQDTLKISYVKSEDDDSFIFKHFFIDRQHIHDILFQTDKIEDGFEITKRSFSTTLNFEKKHKINTTELINELYLFRDQYQKKVNFKYYAYNYLENIVLDQNYIKFELNKKFSHLNISEELLNKKNLEYFSRKKLDLFYINKSSYVKLYPYRNEIDILNNLGKEGIDLFQYTEIPKFIDLNQKQFVQKYRQYEILRDDIAWYGIFFNSDKLNNFTRKKLKKSINRDFLNKKFSSYQSELSNSIFKSSSQKYFNRDNIVYDPLDVIQNLKSQDLKPLRFIYPIHSELLAYIAGEITIQLSEVGILIQPLAVSLQEYIFRLENNQYELALVNLFYKDSEHIELLNLLQHYLKLGTKYQKYLRTLEQIDDERQIAIIHKLQDLLLKSDSMLPLFFTSKLKFMIDRSFRKIVDSQPINSIEYVQKLRHISTWVKNEE